MEHSLPGFSVHEILQARRLECPPLGDLPDSRINPANARDTRDAGLILESGRSPRGGGVATHSNLLARRIPWTEDPMTGYSPWGRKESDTTEGTSHVS